MAEKVLIKKYANRRLYDTEKSVYITLDDINTMIKQGQRVEIIDAKTKEDVTAFILTQIIMEETKKSKNILPISLLLLFIQYGENVLGEFFEKYLEQSIQNYLTYKSFADEQYQKWLEMGIDFSNLSRSVTADLTSFKPFFDASPFTEKSKDEK